MRRSALVLCAGLALAGLARGQATAASAAPSAELAPRDGTAVLYPRTDAAAASHATQGGWSGAGTTLLVVVFGAAGGWMLWNRLRRSGPLAGSEHHLAIAETRSLGNRQFLVVARYEEKKFLLSVCPGRIELLTRLDS